MKLARPLVRAAVGLAVLAAGCASAAPASARGATPTPSATARAETLPWIEDDYAGALALARRRQRPLVVDMGADWCHTCLSMKHFVLTDPSFLPLADRFVWLALDTEKAVNAAALAKLPMRAWPTFFVVSPHDESVQARFVGSASPDQFREFLREGERGHLDALAAGSRLAADDPSLLARAGDRAALAGNFAAADRAYGAALARAPADWARRAEVLVAAIGARHDGEAWAACVELGLAAAGDTGQSASAADFLAYATACALELPVADPRRHASFVRAAERLTALVSDDTAPLSIDDRSDAMRILREVKHQLGDAAGARATAMTQRALLDRAATAAHSVKAAMTYLGPRAEVYVYLGQGAELVADLEAAERKLPREYDPPYRLAWLQLQLGNHEAALAACRRALARVYGPRTARVYDLLAAIHHAHGDRTDELAARRAVVEVLAKLPAGHARPAALAQARADLAALEAGAE
jgi:hypothetical protein